MFGFLEYFFNFSIVVLLTKLNPVVVCWKPWPFSWIFVVKTALIWLVLVGFFCVFSQSESICNLHSCYKFALVLHILHSCYRRAALLSQPIRTEYFFVYIISYKIMLSNTYWLKNLENVISMPLVFRPLHFYQMQIQYFLNKKSTCSICCITFGTFVRLSSKGHPTRI